MDFVRVFYVCMIYDNYVEHDLWLFVFIKQLEWICHNRLRMTVDTTAYAAFPWGVVR